MNKNFFFAFFLSLLSLKADDIVRFDSPDYVTSTMDMRGYDSMSGEIPFTEMEPRYPTGKNYNTSIPGAAFYGGFETTGDARPFNFRVGNHGATWETDFIQAAGNGETSTASATVVMLIVWLQPAFLNGHDKQPVHIQSNGGFEVGFRSGMSATEAEVRIVVKKGGKFYVSDVVGNAKGTRPTTVVADAGTLNWHEYNPEILGEIGRKTSISLEDVTGIGVWGKGTVGKDGVSPRVEIGKFIAFSGS